MPNPAIQSLGDYIQPDLPCLVLSGAGCSTGSGLGDYRDKHGRWKRPQPMTGQQFLASESSRKRYWARSFTGWPLFNAAKPNACHTALVQMQQLGLTTRLVTQNVDGLHQQAGHREVIDLHGRLDRVLCTDCGLRQARQNFQQQLLRNNPPLADLTAEAAPDGDADLSQTTFDWLRLPACPDCGGVIKPDVVFFGDTLY